MERVRCLLGWIVAIAAAAALAGCGLSDALGMGRRTPPDEFAVVQKAPLVIPPDFGLRPPQLGERPLLGAPVAVQAREALLGAGAVPARALTQGEAALLQAVGADEADPAIRARILRETEQVLEGGRSFAEGILFWRRSRGGGEALDPAAEAERLRAEGAAVVAPPAQPRARRTGR